MYLGLQWSQKFGCYFSFHPCNCRFLPACVLDLLRGALPLSSTYTMQIIEVTWFHFLASTPFKGNSGLWSYLTIFYLTFTTTCLSRLEADRLYSLPKSSQLEAHTLLLIQCSLQPYTIGWLVWVSKWIILSIFWRLKEESR